MQRLLDLADRRPALAGAAAFALLAALVRPADYAKPISADAGQFLYVGETVAQGGMPYTDAAYNKGPLTALLFGAIDPLVGSSPSLLRLTLVPFAAVAALALAGYVARHAGRAAGVLAGVTFALVSGVGAFEGSEVKTEQYGVAPALGALWLAARGGPRAAAGAGALLACAALVNPAFLVLAPAIGVALLLGTAAGARLRHLLVAALGALVPVAAAAAWLAAGGALDDALAQVGATIGQLPTAPESGDGGRVASPELQTNLPAEPLWAMAVAGCALAARSPRLRPPAAVLGLVLVAVLLRGKLPQYEFDYHYYPALPAIAGAIALGVASVWPDRARGRLLLAAAVLVVPVGWYVAYAQGKLLRKDPVERMPAEAPALAVADFLRESTEPGERVLVPGGFAQVYWKAERRAPTRYFDVHGLIDDDAWRERDRALLRDPPVAVAVVGPERIERDPALAQMVRDAGHVPVRLPGGSVVWRR